MEREPPRVLVVDDEPAILASLRFLAAKEGWQVATATDGEAALLLARETLPHLVVLDVMLPRVDGIAVCRQLRTDRRFDATPIVLLSAKSGTADVERGHDAGADLYLGKPFSTQDLMARLRALLRTRAAGDGGCCAAS